MSREQLDRFAHLPLMGSDDAGCNVLHVDMDAFFAAVELRERPELIGRPVIIGRRNGRGVVVSATYEARAFGVHSAMPMGRALRACPNAVVIEPTRGKYSAASSDVMGVLNDVSARVDVVSIDEAFLDVAGAARTFGSPVEVATHIRRRMADELALPCSVGVARVTMVAKIASTLAKPDGLLVVPVGDTIRFLHALPIGRLWGVGAKTVAMLASIGVYSVSDLAQLPPTRLAHAVGKGNATKLLALANGQELRPVAPRAAEKSIGSERTFDFDIRAGDRRALDTALRAECETVAVRLRTARLTTKRVTVKIRAADFQTVERSHTLAAPTSSTQAVLTAARQLLDQAAEGIDAIRLVGVRCDALAALASTGQQLTFDQSDTSTSLAEEVLDQVVARFGADALRRASVIKENLEN